MALISVQFRLFAAILLVIFKVSSLILNFLYNPKPKRLPFTSNKLLNKSATQLAQEIRLKEISSTELVAAYIDRQKEINPIINAIVEERYQLALDEARKVDEFLRNSELSESELAMSKPLLGVPVSIKESLSLKGMSLSVGSLKRKGLKATESGDCVRKLIEAGAIPLCVTNTPEKCLSIETHNLVTGRTNNPYNTLHNAGGSSGGEGALISSAGSVCGLGSDIAGSIRIPCAFNGIFGHKMSRDCVNLDGHFPNSKHPNYSKQMSIGPMSRHAEDLLLISKIITTQPEQLQLDKPVTLSKLKIAYMVDCGSCFGVLSVQEEIKKRIRDAVDHFRRNLDCEISDVKFDELQFSPEASLMLHFQLSDNDTILDGANVYWEIVKTVFNKSQFCYTTLLYALTQKNSFLLPVQIDKAEMFMDDLRKKFIDVLGDNGVFLYPSFPTSAIPHYGGISNGIGVMYPIIVNMLGLPATCVPVGFDKNGLPIGIQVIGAPYQDRLCLAVARELEEVFGGWSPPY